MNQFEYIRTTDSKAAIKAMTKTGEAQFLAGGTNLVDLMKMRIVVPDRLIDINPLPLRNIEKTLTGVRIGALASNSEVAEHPLVKKSYPLLSMAINAGASAQLRNMATTGGNMMQRTRCPYFFDVTLPCNKRSPGSGCSALEGYNRMHAIFGASTACIAVNPSDMSVGMATLDAVVHVSGPKGDRSMKFTDFHRLPGDEPQKDNNLLPGELIIAVDLPVSRYPQHVAYVKVRDRNSYAFALISVAAALEIRDGIIHTASLGMGGVAHKPWRLTAAEDFLAGKKPVEENFRKAAAISMEGAKAYGLNKFKLTMAPNAIRAALQQAAAKA